MCWVDLKQPTDGLGLEPRGFVHALGRATSRGAQQELYVLRGEDPQDGVDDGGLADPRNLAVHAGVLKRRTADRRPVRSGAVRQTTALTA